MVEIRPLIDLRTSAERQGLSRTAQTAQSIAGIFRTAGEIQKKNRERQTLDRVARAIASGKTTVEAIAEAAREPESVGGGFRGGLERIVGAFEPKGGGIGEGIQQSIISETLRKALAPKSLLTPEEQRESALVKGGLKPRAKATKPTEPFEQTKPQKERDRAIKVLTEEHKSGPKEGELKASDAEIADAEEQLRANPSLRDVGPGKLDKAFKAIVKEEQIKSLRIKKKGRIFTDARFGEIAYNAALKKAKRTALARGATEASIEREFNRWWDEQVEKETGDDFKEFVPRAEFKIATTVDEFAEQSETSLAGQGTPAPDTSLDIKLQTAPDAKLDEFWPNLPDEEKKEIIQRLDEDPKNIDSILSILQAG